MLCVLLSIIATATRNGFIQAEVGAVTGPWRKARTFYRISCGGYLTMKTVHYEDQYFL